MLYQTHVQIHLDNIRRNLELVRSRIGPERKFLLPVKGNAYGYGAVVIASMVQRTGLADWFGVATIPEGIELRDAGIRLPILKFSPAFPEEMGAAVDNGITLAVCDPANIMALQAVCKEKDAKARVHLKVDTGLGRIGVAASDAPGLALLIEKDCPNIHLEGVFSHFAVSDLATGASYTEEQITVFKKAVGEISAALGRTPELLHCANSGGVMRHENGWMNMVRSGQVPFGWLDTLPDGIKLYPGISFHTRISFLKRIKEGMRIGYGLTWGAEEDTWIGSMPVGYGDGLNRLFSNHGRVLVKGKSYPIVGLICMDQTMINLGPVTDVKVGDEAVLLGRSGDEEITIREYAEALKTVPWEFTSLYSPRVKRIYVTDSGQP